MYELDNGTTVWFMYDPEWYYFEVPDFYGFDGCRSYDIEFHPTCLWELEYLGVFDFWCTLPWCFVDKDNCDY